MRLATFNILHGRSLEDDRVDVGRYAAAIASLDADVVALQEVDRSQERSARADLTAVAAEALDAGEHRFVAALSGTPGATWMAATGQEQPDEAAYGIALLSRFPVRSWEVVRLPSVPCTVPVVFPGQRRPKLVRDEPRVAVVAAVEDPSTGRCLTVASTHLSFVPGWNSWQLRRLARTLRRSPAPVVLMGDLNLEPEAVRRSTGMRPLVRADTFPVHAPERQLDHVLVGDDGARPLRVHDARARRLPLSDHLALTVDLD
ncbi:endonuclease/exonuclease/phosphatase family protein [Paenibacillus sp. TRM 82003]|uniref:endonuclease/exonuclease/phosphatase family protein n=1 Tax=Kineococcus sp. TRM81007 TaxID=2925831 RepID=UPI001F584B13|nr:endonuclease/exonuclease/phosphatase family protein [Kineococcus sp. TRM81007]MCI2238189.1 endonuclease/exonuclease/phosphatase family protein [Kineococcus sp. TRM81007]MCI3920573.1 endonuclease/exonuclease/phosphatase family protein [Paenibacillus sp. TRM 82003]